MALEFPSTPIDGQLYPNPAQPGVQQYKWNGAKGTWETQSLGVVQRVSGTLPIEVGGQSQTPNVSINPATTVSAGSLSAADKAKLDNLNEGVQAVTAGTGLGAPTTGATITTSGTINLLASTSTTIGGVKAGPGVNVQADGTLLLNPPTSLLIGGVRAGSGVSITPDGIISSSASFQVLNSLAPSFNGSSTTFQLTSGGIPVVPPSANSLLVFIGGIFQIPGEAFTVLGSTIQFTSAPAANLTFYGVSLT